MNWPCHTYGSSKGMKEILNMEKLAKPKKELGLVVKLTLHL